jgi:cytochrome oxidase Cu insertion factor (SCO1/SenC/PrrC family)
VDGGIAVSGAKACGQRFGGALRRFLLAGATAALGVAAVLVVAFGVAWAQGGPRRAAGPPADVPAAQAPGPRVGEEAPDFALRDVDGRPARLSDWRGRMPVVIEFGSYSCPICTGQVSAMDALARQFEGRAQFLLIYTDEAHPGAGGLRSMSYGTFRALPQAQGRGERLDHARLFLRELSEGHRILVDEDGPSSADARYGGRHHGVFVVDARGRVCWKSDNVDPARLAAVLRRQVGGPTKPKPAAA